MQGRLWPRGSGTQACSDPLWNFAGSEDLKIRTEDIEKEISLTVSLLGKARYKNRLPFREGIPDEGEALRNMHSREEEPVKIDDIGTRIKEMIRREQ